MGLMRDLDGLNAAYASMQESGPMVLTKADKVGNTPAWRNRHKKSVKTGKPLYKMAGHLKDEYESELWNTVSKNLTELHQLGGVQFKVIPLDEKQKDTPDQVKAVIAYDKARKGTEDATYDSEHGKKKQAKKERDYAKWQRDKGAEDAQKSGHPWEHAKGSTREKEGKKSEKHAHIKDSYVSSNWRDDLNEILTATQKQDEKEVTEKNVKNKVVIDPNINIEQVVATAEAKECCEICGSYDHTTSQHKKTQKEEIEESLLWDKVAEELTRLSLLGGRKFKVVAEEE